METATEQTDFASGTRVRTVELAQHVDTDVQLQGWLHAIRRLGQIGFLILRDGWGTAQIVVDDAPQLESLTRDNIMPESVLRVTGRVVRNAQAPGGLEIHHPRVEIVNAVHEPLPVLFGTPAYLAQSPQFYKQVMVGVFERVFEVGPVFRAEPRDLNRLAP